MKDRAIQVIDSTDDGDVLDLKIKPLRDVDGKILSGIVIGNTLEQNKAFILLGHAGDFKGNPDLGVGIGDLTLGSELLEYRHKVREQFTRDGLKITKLDMYDIKNITIDAHYEKDN